MSAIHDAENMTAEKLKADREAVIKSIKGEPADVLAARFVDARYDAKVRDDKLTEQADTLNALKMGLDAVKAKAAADASTAAEELAAANEATAKYRDAASASRQELEAAAISHTQEHKRLLAESASVIEQKNTEIAELQDKLTKETARAERLHIAAHNAHVSHASTLSMLLKANQARELAEASAPDAGE